MRTVVFPVRTGLFWRLRRDQRWVKDGANWLLFYCHRAPCADNLRVRTQKTGRRKKVPVLHAPHKFAPQQPSELQRILRLEVPVVVKLAERKLTMGEVLRLGVGAIVEFSKSSDEPLELLINNKPIGVGEAVKVGENFGLKITQVGDVKQIIRSLGTQR